MIFPVRLWYSALRPAEKKNALCASGRILQNRSLMRFLAVLMIVPRLSMASTAKSVEMPTIKKVPCKASGAAAACDTIAANSRILTHGLMMRSRQSGSMVGHNRRDIIYVSSLPRLRHFDNILDVPQAPARNCRRLSSLECKHPVGLKLRCPDCSGGADGRVLA